MTYPSAQEALANAREDCGFQEDFEGKTCSCPGWDGDSLRCECGNRRVDWEAIEHPDGTFYAVAVAL